jgi:hypothetical protein
MEMSEGAFISDIHNHQNMLVSPTAEIIKGINRSTTLDLLYGRLLDGICEESK